ncbi:IclR family transcriptional regulator [Paenibacillaceae bacterium WGS1546]|uniref:IclR family transcriptional regulator n=1 Tax=Cohnella sp. WGS1546 TaxID=3366810 RepID=UPI00372D7E75
MSAEKTLEILDLFNLNSRELSVAQIAERLEQPTSSVYRHLRLLKDRGYVIESNIGTYKLGYRFLALAKIVRTDNSLSSLALPAMRNLTSETEETSILTIASELNVVCLETTVSPQPIMVSAEQGQLLPLHAGASSKPFLAYMPEETVDELHKRKLLRKYTDRTITDPNELKSNLEEIRTKGYSASDSEVDEGVYAYGAAIRDSEDRVVAVLSIAGPRERVLGKDESMLIGQLQAAIEEIQKHI